MSLKSRINSKKATGVSIINEERDEEIEDNGVILLTVKRKIHMPKLQLPDPIMKLESKLPVINSGHTPKLKMIEANLKRQFK